MEAMEAMKLIAVYAVMHQQRCQCRTDRLYRFRSEGFVVMLQPTPEVHVMSVFNRFRQTPKKHYTPQIGKFPR
jgi:hypothetical protein